MLKQVQHDVGMVAFVVHITVNNELGARFPFSVYLITDQLILIDESTNSPLRPLHYGRGGK